MKLFKLEGYRLNISEEAYMLKPFKNLYNRDKSKDKSKALMELAFIYFFSDPRSDYQYIVDDEDRKNAIKEGEGLSRDWQPDKMVLEAIEFYKTFQPVHTLLLNDTRFVVDKLRTKLRNMDLDEVDSNGKPVYTLNTIVSTIKQVPELIKALDEAEKAIALEIKQNDKVKGSQSKHMFEDV